MQHAREDYNVIQDTTAARKLAELVLSMQIATDAAIVARRLAREVLGITDHGRAPAMNPITTNGTTRLIPDDEPVFLIRGQDNVAGATVRAWADMAAANGADAEILRIAREHAAKMDDWPKKKTADLPSNAQITRPLKAANGEQDEQ